jgi:hypothetical protein
MEDLKILSPNIWVISSMKRMKGESKTRSWMKSCRKLKKPSFSKNWSILLINLTLSLQSYLIITWRKPISIILTTTNKSWLLSKIRDLLELRNNHWYRLYLQEKIKRFLERKVILDLIKVLLLQLSIASSLVKVGTNFKETQ